jgi:predicted  nucleic acid-binding Zn-ribbon protein
VDRRYEIESLRRSLAMLQPGAMAGLRREEAMDLIEEVQGLQSRLEQLRMELRRLAEEGT